eukprot:9425743-Pyramimonas_sp.AAC.1
MSTRARERPTWKQRARMQENQWLKECARARAQTVLPIPLQSHVLVYELATFDVQFPANLRFSKFRHVQATARARTSPHLLQGIFEEQLICINESARIIV